MSKGTVWQEIILLNECFHKKVNGVKNTKNTNPMTDVFFLRHVIKHSYTNQTICSVCWHKHNCNDYFWYSSLIFLIKKYCNIFISLPSFLYIASFLLPQVKFFFKYLTSVAIIHILICLLFSCTSDCQKKLRNYYFQRSVLKTQTSH